MNEQISQPAGHPKGLWVLFGTEMWERFNFYGMRAILSLFLSEALLMGETESSRKAVISWGIPDTPPKT